MSKCLIGTYGSEESDNQWKHLLMNKGKVIQTNQQIIQYFHNQTKLQEISPYSFIGSLQQVHLVIGKQESMSSQVVGLMSRMSFIVSIVPQNILLIHDNGIQQYHVEIVFKDDYGSLIHGVSWKEINCHVHNRFFGHPHKLYILQVEGTDHRFKMCHN